MSDFRDHLNSRMEDCDFKREWDAQADERQVMRKIVEARMAEGMTQVELAEACGMKPANLCRLENGNGEPFGGNAKQDSTWFGQTTGDLFRLVYSCS